MIFYFSGTGNSAWAAKQLAKLTQDQTVDISMLENVPSVQKEEQIGFVFPIYAWGPPEEMIHFVEKLDLSGGFVFAVCTCGREAGKAMKQFTKHCPVSSSYSLIMPNNYIVGTDTEKEQSIREKIGNARKEIQVMSQEILARQNVYRVKEGTLASLKSHLVNCGFNQFARSAKPFFADDRCDGCGLCAKRCPVSAIVMKEDKPVWKDKCAQCMRCINACPKQAIQYGKATVGRHRYMIDRYVSNDDFVKKA